MLQGNPFETQVEVRERTDHVRHEMAMAQGARSRDVRVRVERWWNTVELSFELRSLQAPSLNALKAAWWLPAGIAIAFLLSVFISQ